MASDTPIGRRLHLGPVPHLSPWPLLGGMLVSAMPTYAPLAAGALHLPVLGSVRHAAPRCYEWTLSVQAEDGSVKIVTDMAIARVLYGSC